MDIKNINNEIKEKYGSVGDSQWMRLEEGDNKIRIVQTTLSDYGNHYLPSKKKSYACIGKEECPLCENEQPSVKFMTWVIDRKDGVVKILEVGYSIVKQLTKLANDSEYGIDESGFPYDINISREGTGQDTTYSVIAGRKNAPLTKEELEKTSNLDDLEEIIEKKKEKTREEFGKSSSKTTDDDDEIDVENIPF